MTITILDKPLESALTDAIWSFLLLVLFAIVVARFSRLSRNFIAWLLFDAI